MRLVNFSCKHLLDFTVAKIDLQAVNLLVGRNGSGKSHILQRIEEFAEVITDKGKYPVIRAWRVLFQDATDTIEYAFAWAQKGDLIDYEQLALNGKLLIDRSQETCKIFSETTHTEEQFSPPANKLVIHVRRDTKAYPYIEKLIEWASDVFSFRFGSIASNIKQRIDQKFSDQNFSPLEPGKSEFSAADIFKRLEFHQRSRVKELLHQLDYKINKIELEGASEDTKWIRLSEKGISYPYDLHFVSQGTFRIFVLLAYLLYLIQEKRAQLIVIDDLGEGLDYSRVVKLGKFIFDMCQEANIQLIATSNDSFLMDAIPIDYWNVIHRNGTEITALNKKNHPKLFENFAYTGLSNFDFFSSDYIASHLK